MPATSLETQAYKRIRNRLLTRQIRPGEQLSDAALASELGISRTPVREAILRLRTEGFVEQIPRMGTFVKVPSHDDLMEMHELRRLLESHAAGRAASRITEANLDRLHELCKEMLEVARIARDSGQHALTPEITERGVLADVEFHLIILRAAGNQRVVKIVGDLHLMSHLCGHNWGNLQKHSSLYRLAHTALDHYRIYKALRDRDGKRARYWMRRHHRPLREVAGDLMNLHRYLARGSASPSDWPDSVRDSIYEMESTNKQTDKPKRKSQPPSHP